MPNRIKDKGLVPTGGLFKYLQPESGLTLVASSWNALIDKVRKHRIANGYDVPLTFKTDVEEGLCELLPAACHDKERTEVAPVKVTLSQVLRFTALLGESVLKGSPRVSLDEANRRATICAGCADNIKAVGCSGCGRKNVEKLIAGLVGSKSTKRDKKLESCRHCGCLNRAQIWFPLDMLQRHTNDRVRDALPEHCWKK
tara:strand:+ start:130 stop:726 length:597 start_codon:yes stop_codon:yes gene_type:complete